MYHISNSEAHLEMRFELIENSIELISSQRRFVCFLFSSASGADFFLNFLTADYHSGWGRFGVYFLDDSGAIYVACPIVPSTMHMDKSQLKQLCDTLSPVRNIFPFYFS
jgi:hypothetical protein